MISPNKRFRIVRIAKANGDVLYVPQYSLLFWFEYFTALTAKSIEGLDGASLHKYSKDTLRSAISFDSRELAMQYIISQVRAFLQHQQRVNGNKIVSRSIEDVTNEVSNRL